MSVEKATILVVDDEEQVRNLLKASLHTQGYQVIPAADGQQAVDYFKDRGAEINAILMDINMPRKDGCQAMREIRALPHGADTPMVVLTALDTPEWEQAAQDAGATLFMTKPFSPKDILHCLRTILDGELKNARAAKAAAKTKPQVNLKIRYQTPQGFMQCYLRNLMDRRSFITTDKILPLGSKFNFEITPPFDEKPFTVEGEVRWINLYADQKGMGVQFSFVNPEDEARVQQWVMNNAKD